MNPSTQHPYDHAPSIADRAPLGHLGASRFEASRRALQRAWRAPGYLRLGSLGELVRCGVRLARHHLAMAWGSRGAARHLVPVAELEARDGRWASLGDDPRMRLGPGHPRLGRGWYMCELSIDCDRPTALAKLYPDLGAGFSEETAVTLPLRSRRMVKRVFHLPSAARALRFDPIEGPGSFEVTYLRFVPITEAFAVDRMERRVRAHHPDWRSLAGEPASAGDVRGEARASDPSLRKALYDATFDPSIVGKRYGAWITEVEAPEWERLDRDRASILAGLRAKPKVSILVPTHDTPAEHLRACIESVERQSYPHWELCIADDASSSPHVRAILEEAMARDARIRVAFRETNGHIAAASNSALHMAEGELVALLDHDDELARHALLSAVMAFDQHPDAELVYSDEDKLDENGLRLDPHFKSGWNPDLLLAQNYVCHLTVMRRARVQAVGGFRPGFEGSQDHDLFLRVTHGLDAHQVIHVPRVLYHWRMTAPSTASNPLAKGYAWQAGLAAVRSALEARGSSEAAVEPGVIPHSYRVRWPLPTPAPRATLVVPTRDGLDVLSKCVGSVLSKTSYPNYELVIVDNQSVEPATHAFLAEMADRPRVRVLRYDAPFNFSAINNFAVAATTGEVVVLLNNDTEVIDGDWLTELVTQAVRDEIGCVGAKLHYTDGRIQHAGVILGIGSVAGHSHKYFAAEDTGYFGRLVLTQNLSAVTGACLAVRRSIYEAVGGLDERNLRVAFNDVDFCLRVRDLGYRNLYSPYAALYHHESVSRGDDNHPDRVARFHAERDYMIGKWNTHVNHDPYYNPNLTRDREDFSLR